MSALLAAARTWSHERERAERQSCGDEVGDRVFGCGQRLDRGAEQVEPVCGKRGDEAFS